MTSTKRGPPLNYPKGQQDMVVQLNVCCPTCGGPWKAAKRVCRKCGQPISSRHKWHTVPASPGLWAFEHRNCEEPGAYQATEPTSSTTEEEQP